MFLKLVSVAPSWWRVLSTSSFNNSSEREAFDEVVVRRGEVSFVSAEALRGLRQRFGRYSYSQQVLVDAGVDYSGQAMLSRMELSSYLVREVRSGFPELNVFIDKGFMGNGFSVVVFSLSEGSWTGSVRGSSLPDSRVYATCDLSRFQGLMFKSPALKEEFMEEQLASVVDKVNLRKAQDDV